MKPQVLSLVTLLLLCACQSPASLPAAQPNASQSAASIPVLDFTNRALPQTPAAYTSPMLNTATFKPEGKVRVEGTTVTLEIQLPPLSQSKEGFKTQALDLSAATKILATVTDSFGKTYQPDGADGGGLVNYPANGVVVLTFNNVVPDTLLFIDLQTRDAGGDIPQAALSTVLNHTTSSNINTTINFLTTPVAKAMKALLVADATRARAINLTDLNTLMNSITGYAAGPPITYTTHPSLVNTALLATDLASTNPNLLTASNYQLAGATVSATVTGLVGSDKLNIQIADAASAIKTDVVNGSGILIPKATPGNGLKVLVGAVAGNSAQYTFSITSGSTVDLTNGNTSNVTIVAPPATVTLTSIAANPERNGQTVTLTGSGFSTVAANNSVSFGGTLVNSANVTVVDTSHLQVVVPNNIRGNQLVTVAVGSQTSGSVSFNVKPYIGPSTATSGTIGTTNFTIIGTGFDPSIPNNTVTFGGVAAAKTGATANSLNVTIPAGIYGTVPIVVRVGTVDSDNYSFAVTPTISNISASGIGSTGESITITGSGFDTATPGNNKVKFGSIEVAATAATTTTLTVAVPEAPAGATTVSVQVGTQTSTTLPFTYRPKLTALTTAEAVSGKAVLVRTLPLTITGTNFDPILANNSVSFTLANSTVINATPTAATATSLTVMVPAGVHVPGDVAVAVTSNSVTSAALTGLIPAIPLSVTNGGFH